MIGRHIMQAVAFSCIFVAKAFSQEPYVSNEHTVSASFFAGRYNTDGKWGAACSYSLKGVLQLSYGRSSVLTGEHVDNFQNEYFLRLYAPQKRRFFLSFGAGYLYQESRMDLWSNYPLLLVSKGVGFEGGLHLVTEDSKSRRVVVSLFYFYFEPETELRTPEIREIERKLARSISADVAVIYYL